MSDNPVADMILRDAAERAARKKLDEALSEADLRHALAIRAANEVKRTTKYEALKECDRALDALTKGDR